MRPSTSLYLLAILAPFAGAGCNSATESDLTPAVRVSPSAPWAGSTIRLQSSAFVRDGDRAELWLGSTPLPLTRLDDTTLTAPLPDSAGGAYELRLVLDGEVVLLDPLTVIGYTGSYEIPPSLEWDVAVWPRNGHATIIGTSAQGLTLIDLDTRAVTSYPALADVSGMRGPGMTYTGSDLILYPDGATTLQAWWLSGGPRLVRAFPDLTAQPRQAMQLGPDAWFFSSHHTFWTSVRTDSTQPYQTVIVQAEETEGVHMSPRGDRSTIQVDYSASGIPVFDSPSGQTAYWLTQLRTSEGVDFSPGGELLAVAGGDRGVLSPARLLLVDATSGTVLRDTLLGEPVFALAFDPVRPLLYVGLSRADSASGPHHPGIAVLDVDTFEPLGLLAPPRSVPSCEWGCYKGVIAISAEPAMYTAWSFSAPLTRVDRYTLPR